MSRTTTDEDQTRSIEVDTTGAGLPRAGLRQASGAKPRPVFEVVETSVLVLVAALAMTTIIVSNDATGRDGVQPIASDTRIASAR